MQTHYPSYRVALIALLVAPLCIFAGCGGDEAGEEASAERVAAIRRAEEARNAKDKYVAETQPGAEEATNAAGPRTPLAAASVMKWPGLEARLMRCERTGNVLNVEVRLQNVGTSPVTIENYDAGEAVVADETSKREYAVFPRGDEPQATIGLTTTVAPGESTTVFAVFPLPEDARVVSVRFPDLPAFAGVAVQAPSAAPSAERERDRAVRAKRAQ